MKPQDIDFRIWNRLREHYLKDHSFVNEGYRSEINFCIGQGKVFAINDEDEVVDIIKDYDVEFYTGFKDSNGDKIYEGDIVRYRGQNLLISYERATWYIIDPSIDENIRVDCGTRLQGILECMKYYQNIDTENQIDVEVIGNIHENKNLLDDSIEQNEPSNTNKTRRMR